MSGDPWVFMNRLEGFEITREGPFPEGESWSWHRPWAVTGVVSLAVGERSFRCLRKFVHHRNSSDFQWIVEVYIAENGRVVLSRGYEGPMSDQYETVKNQPELEHNGIVYRLLCDMLEDWALADSPLDAWQKSPLTRFGRI